MSAEVSTPPRLGRQVKGPTALGESPARLWRLARTLALTDFKLRFFGSALGYLWQLMRPLMLFGVLFLVFDQFLAFGGDVKYYPVGLLMGIVMFSFFSEATGGAVRSLVNRESLVRKIEFPRLAVPIATVITALFNLGLNLVPVFIFLIASGGTPRWSWFELPLIVALLTLFALAVGMLLSVLFVRYRDIEPIWDVVLQVMFYASPIFYTLGVVTDKAGSGVATAMMCNPFAAAMQQARHAVIDPSHISAAQGLGSGWLLVVPIGIVFVLLFVGYAVFSRLAPLVAEDL